MSLTASLAPLFNDSLMRKYSTSLRACGVNGSVIPKFWVSNHCRYVLLSSIAFSMRFNGGMVNITFFGFYVKKEGFTLIRVAIA